MVKARALLGPFLLLLMCTPNINSAQELESYYQQRKFQYIVDLLKAAEPPPKDEKSLYFLALCYARLGRYDESKIVLEGLLATDPSFYAYKIDFDPDLYGVRNKTDLKDRLAGFAAGNTLARNNQLKHVIASTDGGLFLYINGVKVTLALDGKQVMAAAFIASESLYYVTSQAAKNAAAQTTLHFYSLTKRAPQATHVLKGAYSAVSKLGPGLLLLSTSNGLQLFNTKSGQPETAFMPGKYLSHDPAMRQIHYVGAGKQGKASLVQSLAY